MSNLNFYYIIGTIEIAKLTITILGVAVVTVEGAVLTGTTATVIGVGIAAGIILAVAGGIVYVGYKMLKEE